MQPSTLAKRVTIVLLLAVIAFYFYGMGHLPLVGPDEPRYAQVAREMLMRGDLVTPTLGGHTWFEKPALLYWMMMASFKIFGVSEWSARLGPAISGLLTVGAIWCVGRRIEQTAVGVQVPRFGLWSALAAATSLGIIVFSRGASFDIVITMTISWALALFILQEFAQTSRARTILLAGFYGFIGVALIAKGLVGIVIPFGVLTLYYVLRRELPSRTIWASLIWGTPVAMIVASVWYGPVIARHGWLFIDQFFIQHHFARYISNKYHHQQPVYFYLLILIPMTLPWTAFLFDSLAGIKGWQWRDMQSLSKVRVFALAWLLFPILFFSFSGSKLPGYILPSLPAAALLVGERLSRLQTLSQKKNWPLRITGIICLLLGTGGIVYAARSGNLTIRCAALMALPWFIAGTLAILTRLRTAAATVVACATLASIVILLNCGGGQLAQRESVRDLLNLADAHGYAQAPVFARPGGDRTAEFYASGRVVYGADGELLSLDNVSQILAEAQKHSGPILVLAPLESLQEIVSMQKTVVDKFGNGTFVRVEVLGNNARLALVAVEVANLNFSGPAR